MKEIALRHSVSKISNLTFEENSSDQMTFETVKCTDPVLNTTEESGILLNGRKFNNILYKHKDIEIVISSDEIDNDTLAFLQAFWSARFKYISLKKSSTWGSYVQIMTESGKFPLSYIDDIRDLPEVSFNLSYANPI
jgi:hypothetical protein